ncbi:hypothetical protein HYH02_015242 [Chlamydomonas schloesseri]|uniref:Uncharacterized protein n=1 Tax=Chlamydomonas schloesseri TaxID=2026947 RepID=A0A835VSC3_9CHLO|nr:hypothetical protein HYH02_015242 [Chlamydomonas schloesseri]|eukprot:KAG2424063.1 hypothetical protein HYH02_015242 [Chlamydomonas schloesseri]
MRATSLPAVSPAAVRAQRHAALAQTLVQFVARLPPPSPGSPAEALRSRLGARLSVPALGEWIRDFTAALVAGARDQATAASGGAPSAPPSSGAELQQPGQGEDLALHPELHEELERAVERLLSSQPQLLAHDSAVLVARLRGLAGLLQLQVLRQAGAAGGQGQGQGSDTAPAGRGREPGAGAGVGTGRAVAAPSPTAPTAPTALDLALQRPALLLADLPTLERRLAALQAALGLPDREAAVAAAVRAPVWLYMEPPPPPV